MPRISKHRVVTDADTRFAQNLIDEIRTGVILTEKDLQGRSFYWSGKLKLSEMPTRPFILSHAKKPTQKMLSLLSIKPTRSLSGVQVIAVMLPPYPCPANCTYCPSAFDGKAAPKSYTGYEPSTLRAQRLGYDSYRIVTNRIAQLDLTGNPANKIELIYQGSTFNAFPDELQDKVVHDSLDAVLGERTKDIEEAKLCSETSPRRVVGITFETRPDWCNKAAVKKMLSLGGTRVELGVQNPDNAVYKAINRGHTVQDVVTSTRLLKDSAFKVLYHLMPGLPGSDYKKDIKNFKSIFTNDDFKPDMVKIYPCLVIKGTQLYKDWQAGKFEPMEETKATKVIAEVQASIPKWVRVMRINRDIPSTVISAGVMKTNLKQLVDAYMEKKGMVCNCIRCREAGLQSRDGDFDVEKEFDKAKLRTEFYSASGGQEAFISYESKKSLFGFVRLRSPASPFVPEIDTTSALIRELHVYGKAIAVGDDNEVSSQHRGIGKELLHKAEEVAVKKFDAKSSVVISGLGVKEYYKKNFGYAKAGPYMKKKL